MGQIDLALAKWSKGLFGKSVRDFSQITASECNVSPLLSTF